MVRVLVMLLPFLDATAKTLAANYNMSSVQDGSTHNLGSVASLLCNGGKWKHVSCIYVSMAKLS